MRVSPLLLLIPAMLAGCAEEPFVDTWARKNPNVLLDVRKPVSDLFTYGWFDVCYADKTPFSDVLARARQECGSYGLETRTLQTQRWQCRVSAPHMTRFSCYSPDMTEADGTLINPFDKRAVAAWEKRTGKTAPIKNPRVELLSQPAAATTSPAADGGVPASTAPAIATPTAPASQAAPLRPEDIAGKPAITAPSAPPDAVSTPVPTSPAVESFSLPQGSWGDSFNQ